LRKIRIEALRDSPTTFLTDLKDELAYGEQQWRQEFSRGEWHVLLAGDEQIGILGVTWVVKGKTTLPRERNFERLWVAPGFRGAGAGSMLLQTALGGLRGLGVHTIWLYVLAGNPRATRFYQKCGFVDTNEPHLLPDHEAGSEDLMKLSLDGQDTLP
jgi:GNAT superfamily N-acetyltransferase